MKSRVISSKTTVRELASLLEEFRVLFVEGDGKLVGSVTNGDFRRAIAGGIGLGEQAVKVMNQTPLVIHPSDGYHRRFEKIRLLPKELRYLPVIDEVGRILEIVSEKALTRIPNAAVLMAGGLGSRLKTLTNDTPKPLLRVGGKPILQHILEQLRKAGVTEFFISVNYRAELIMNYFKDGSDWDVQIRYLHEKEKLGTAGCLSLIQSPVEQPLIVVNGDVLSDVNFHEVLEHHRRAAAAATICVSDHRYEIPYGVVQMGGDEVTGIFEKPTETYSINAGIYVLDANCLSFIPRNQYYDMPALLEQLRTRGLRVTGYKVQGLWIDIGNIEDFRRANQMYSDAMTNGD